MSFQACVFLVLHLRAVTLTTIRLASLGLALAFEGRSLLEFPLEVCDHGNELLFIGGPRSPELAGCEVGELGSGLSHQLLMSEVGAQIAIVVGILLLLHVILEGIVRGGKVGIEQLGNGVVNGRSLSEDLGVVHIEI